MTALAARDARVADLDRQVRAFSLAVLARVNNSRRAPFYQVYFPVGTRPVIYAPVEVELTHVGAILAKLAEEADPSLRAFLAPLQLAAGSTRAAIDARHAASDAEASAFGLLRAESIHWMAAYRRSYRDLQRMFYQDLERAESFFRSSGVAWGGARGEETADRAAASIVPFDRSTIRLSAPGGEVGDSD
jgi:hypothetical protein